MYFSRYEKEDVQLRVVRRDGQLALAAYVEGATEASYFILMEWESGRVSFIRTIGTSATSQRKPSS